MLIILCILTLNITMKIRPASAEDAPRISEIVCESFYITFSNPDNDAEVKEYLSTLNDDAISSMIERKDTTFLINETKAGINGFIQLVDEVPFEQGEHSCLKIERLYLDLKSIGTGVGFRLLNAAIERGLEGNYDKVWLQVLRSNTKAVAFYERSGFKTFDTSPGKFQADRELDLWMERDLP